MKQSAVEYLAEKILIQQEMYIDKEGEWIDIPKIEYENEYCKHDIISAINFGAKWQQKRSYSEEEVLSFGKFCIGKVADFLDGKGDQTDGKEYSMKELLEKFKKK